MSALEVLAPPLATRVARSLYFRPKRLKVKPAERAVLETGERFVLQDQGNEIVCRSWGQGRPVLLVHGWSGALSQLTPFVEPLVSAGFHVVGFDWPGHGESGGSESSLLHAGRVLGALGRLAGPFAGVVAHSFGAAATVYAAANTGLQIDRLVLHAPVASLTGYLDAYSSAWGFSDSSRRAFVASCESWLERPFSAFDPVGNAAKLKRPALVLHSLDDREVTIDDARAMADALGATVSEKGGLGHRRLLADPTCISESVAFLSAPDA